MISVAHLPALNATLNAVSLVLLLVGRRFIGRGNVPAHKRCMVSAFVVSIVFLISYLAHHWLGGETKFGGMGWVRPAYFVLLASHVLLAAIVPILASRTLYLGLKGRFEVHRWWARITFPIWVYVSATGIIVYFLLFRLYTPLKG
ncbi:MAG: DUF420 domain-containing protein [Planctomycetes bacterium]|nr:DUF420 domain-containing protein [Planctomycetota bacterium]MBI3833318.1 DUF420 domain-containing protein [Planctomycetota bacterium]